MILTNSVGNALKTLICGAGDPSNGNITVLGNYQNSCGLRSTTPFYIGNGAGNAVQTLFASNVTGSAKRLKENIKPLTDEEAHKILTMLPVSFTWKKDSPFCGDSISFIADDVAEIDERFVYHSMDERGNRQVEGLQVNPFLAAYGLLLKEHEKRLEELQKKVEKFAALSNLLIEKGVCTQKEIDNL